MASSTLYEGWGRAGWSEGSWGSPILVVNVDGVAATGAVGSVTVVAEANVFPTGLEATGAVGTVTVDAEANVPVTGLEATGSVGGVTVTADANINVTGLEATGEVGSATVVGEANVTVTGVEATGAVGTVTVDTETNAPVTGLEATGAVGTVTTAGAANVSVTGVSAEALTPRGGSAFTADGNAQLSTAQAKFGPSSLLLDGTDDFVTSDENIDLSSGDFTVDMWIRPTSVTGYKGLWQSGTSSRLDVYLIGNQVQGVVGGSTTLFLSSTRISANVWTMISVEREGNVHRLYINGALEASSSTGNRPDAGVFAIGKNPFGDFNGYIDEVRLSSTARYEGTSFTEPTEDYAVDGNTTALLHFDGANGSTDIVNETEGGVTVRLGQTIEVTGLEAISAVGSVTASAGADVDVTGLAATGGVGTVLVWGKIVPDQNPSYSQVIPSQSPIWAEDAASQTPGWAEETPSQSPSWTEETAAQTPNWTEIAA
jgi:hypothetical protein